MIKMRENALEVVAVAGTQHTAFKWMEEYMDGLDPDPAPTDAEGDNFNVLIISKVTKKAALSFNGHPPIQIIVPCAIGSGGDIALGAMISGKSPKQAIIIAGKRDLATGGKIQEITL